jgi:outer membrane immunogenic protein
MMKRFLLITTVALGFSQASAADLQRPVLKAPPPEALFSWAGLYIGVHAGWLRSTNSTTDIDGLQDDEGTRLGHSANSFAAGGHIGFNWQNGMWVLGAEADISGTGASSSVVQDLEVFDGRARTKVSWLASARGRLGISPAPQWLLYGTGGVAWARIKNETLDFDDPNNTGDFTVFDPSDSSSKSSVRTGWVAGGGFEYALSSNWIGRVEYLHYDLGNTTTVTPSEFRFRFSNRFDVVRAGLSYKF